MNLSPEQIETIREKHPDFDFEKFMLWHRAIQQELKKSVPSLKLGCE